MADTLPRERWILAADVLFVVFAGLFPNVIVIQRSSEADLMQDAIHTRVDVNPIGKVKGPPRKLPITATR